MTTPGYTDHAQRVLDEARAYADELGHTYVGSEHLLVGLVRGNGIAAGVLQSMNVDAPRVESAVEFIVGGPVTPKADR